MKAVSKPESSAPVTSISFLKQKQAPKSVQIDDPKLAEELKDSEQDDLVSEVILALNDRSLPLKMRDTSATLLKGFRSQDENARNLALGIAAKVAASDNSEIDILGTALNARLDIFLDGFREQGDKAAVESVDENLLCAITEFGSAICARQIKFASTDEDEEFDFDSEQLNRYVNVILHAPTDRMRMGAGDAFVAVVAAFQQNDPKGTLGPKLKAWAVDRCTAEVDTMSDAASQGGSRHYVIAYFVQAFGSAFVFRDCGLAAVLHHARDHFGKSNFPTNNVLNLLEFLPKVGGRCVVPFLTNPERFLALDIIVDLCGRGAALRTSSLAAARSLVSQLHLVDINETMQYLLNIATSRYVDKSRHVEQFFELFPKF